MRDRISRGPIEHPRLQWLALPIRQYAFDSADMLLCNTREEWFRPDYYQKWCSGGCVHKPLSKVSQLGRRGFLEVAGVAALSDSLLGRTRVVKALLAKDGSVQDW